MSVRGWPAYLGGLWQQFGTVTKYFLILTVVSVPVDAYLNHRASSLRPAVPGLPAAPRALTLQYLEPQALNRRLADVHRAEYSDTVRCRRLGLMALGLVHVVEPPPLFMPTGWLDRFLPGNAMGGFYVPGSDTLFLPATMSVDMAHEVVHAYDDQTGTRIRQQSRAHTTDEGVALRAAIEGSAIVASHGTAVAALFNGDLDNNAVVLAYGMGPSYVRQAARDDMAAMMRLAPMTTAAILFAGDNAPASPRLHWPDPVLAPGERVLCADVVGALGVLTALAGMDAPLRDATAVAGGWAGDRVLVVDTPSGPRADWSIAFRDSAAAAIWSNGPAAAFTLARPRATVHTLLMPGGGRPAPSPLERLGK
jgi:hypothetical protein